MQYPTIVGFPDFSRFSPWWEVSKTYLLSLVRVLSYAYVNTKYPFSARVFLCGIVENPTFFVRRNREIPHHKNSHRIYYRAVAAPPYPQRLCRHSPWQHPPWTQIVAPRLPMSLLQAASARVRAHCDRSPCLGRQNGTHR